MKTAESAEKDDDDPTSGTTTCKAEEPEITEGVKGYTLTILLILVSCDFLSCSNSACSPLPDPLLVPVWEDNLKKTAFTHTHTEPISNPVHQLKEFDIVYTRGKFCESLILILNFSMKMQTPKETSLLLP
jgi:hypothetical protein